jgi:hypothetical protein
MRTFLDTAVPVLAADRRFRALLLAGSAVTGGMDEWSDLDTVVVVEDAAWESLWDEHFAVVARLGTLLVAFRADHFGEPRLLICLYDDPLLHVDVKFVAARDLLPLKTPAEVCWSREPLSLVHEPSRPSAFDVQWCADRLPGWVHYAAIKLGRGELFELSSTLDFLRNRVLGPLVAIEAGRAPRGVRRLDAIGGPRLAELGRTVSPYDRAALAEAARAAFSLASSLLDGHPDVARHRHAEARVLAFLDEVIRG